MTGDRFPKQIHFFLIGHAQEHLQKALGHFGPDAIVLFTSEDLLSSTDQLREELAAEGVVVLERVVLSPFSGDALESMTRQILEIHDKYAARDARIILGLTGGTNLMVIAMALVALVRGCAAHYCVNDEKGSVLLIDILQNLSPAVDYRLFEDVLQEEAAPHG